MYARERDEWTGRRHILLSPRVRGLLARSCLPTLTRDYFLSDEIVQGEVFSRGVVCEVGLIDEIDMKSGQLVGILLAAWRSRDK